MAREVIGLDCFTDYYPRPLKEAQPRGAPRHAAATRSSRARSADADLPSLLDGVTHVFHLAAQAGVRKSWGREFQVYTALNVDATQMLLEACVGPADRTRRLRLELVGVRRRGAAADAGGRAAAAGVARTA